MPSARAYIQRACPTTEAPLLAPTQRSKPHLMMDDRYQVQVIVIACSVPHQ